MAVEQHKAFPSYRLPRAEARFRQWMTELTGIDGPDLDEWLTDRAREAVPDFAGDHVDLPLRTREILLLAAAGQKRQQIARRLFISPETVKSNLRDAYRATGLPNTTALVVHALATGQLSGVDEERAAA